MKLIDGRQTSTVGKSYKYRFCQTLYPLAWCESIKEKPYKVGVGFLKVGVHLDVMIVIVIISESLTPVMMSQNCG